MTGIKGKIAIGVRIIFGLLFAFAGVMKLAGVEHMVKEFDQVGFGQWLRYATGIAEVAGALLLIRARTASLGALLLILVCAGALYAQAVTLHEDVVHPIVMGVILAWIGWGYRQSSPAPIAA